MSWLPRRGASGFAPADQTVTVHVPGAEPVGQFTAAILDGSFGHRMDGRAGHVGIGAYGPRALGELGPRQAFIGAAHLQNKIQGALGGPYDAAPHGKAAPQTTPETSMQRVLSAVGSVMPFGSR